MLRREITSSILFDLITDKLEPQQFLDLKQSEVNHILKAVTFGRSENLLLDWLIKNNLRDFLNHDDFKRLLKLSQLRALNNKKIFRDFELLSQVLNYKSISFIPLKGLHINMKKNGFKRNIRDIDILINKDDIRESIEVLLGEGYSFLESSLDYKNKNFIKDYSYDVPRIFSPSGTCIEIHHKIFNTNTCFLSEMIFANAKQFFFRGVEYKISKSEDLFLHLIYHSTSKQGLDVGIQVFDDLIEIIGWEDFDAERVLDLSKKIGLKNEVDIFSRCMSNFSIENKLTRTFVKDNIYDDKLLGEFIDLMIFNKSSSKALKFLSPNFIKNIKVAISNDQNINESTNNILEFNLSRLKIFFFKFINFLPIIFKLIFNKKYRKDNYRVLEVLRKIKDEK